MQRRIAVCVLLLATLLFGLVLIPRKVVAQPSASHRQTEEFRAEDKRREAYNHLVQEGNRLLEQHKYSEAADKFGEAFKTVIYETEKPNYDILYQRALAYQGLQCYQKALDDAEQR